MNDWNSMSARDIVRKTIRRIPLHDNDVVLVRAGTPLGRSDVFPRLAHAIGKSGKRGCVAVVVESFDDLGVLTEQDMAQHGWFKHSESTVVLALLLCALRLRDDELRERTIRHITENISEEAAEAAWDSLGGSDHAVAGKLSEIAMGMYTRDVSERSE